MRPRASPGPRWSTIEPPWWSACASFVHQKLGDAAIVEDYIEGRELYVSLIGNGETLRILPIIELLFDPDKSKPEDRIATKQKKWKDQSGPKPKVRQVMARPLSALALQRIEAACREGFRALWLRDSARFDLRLDTDDNVWVLEANANPYPSEGHEIANSARKAGLNYADFIEELLHIASSRIKEPES